MRTLGICTENKQAEAQMWLEADRIGFKLLWSCTQGPVRSSSCLSAFHCFTLLETSAPARCWKFPQLDLPLSVNAFPRAAPPCLVPSYYLSEFVIIFFAVCVASSFPTRMDASLGQRWSVLFTTVYPDSSLQMGTQ